MSPFAVLRYCYPDVRLEILPAGKIAVHDPQRRKSIVLYVRAYERKILNDLLKQTVGNEKEKARRGSQTPAHAVLTRP